jgi:hypothetical protein
MKRYMTRSFLANFLFLLNWNAFACGYCLQDRIASVYDHVLVAKTKQLNQKMLYMVWDGPAARDETTKRHLLAIVSRVRGVTKDSVRVALEPPTIGLAYQPSIISRERIETLLLQQLRSMNIVVSVLPE